jgi:dihydroxyacid dehydratase/phosphogluconate dehydratase
MSSPLPFFYGPKGVPGSEEMFPPQARLTILNEDWKKQVEKSSM